MEVQPRKKTLRQGWVVRDMLDVADIQSEAAHQYRQVLKGENYPEIAIPFRRNFGYHEEIDEKFAHVENEQEILIPYLREHGILNLYDIVDAGRRIDGSEEFVLSNLNPEIPAYLIARTCDNSGLHPRFEYQMDVYVNGIFVDTWKIGEPRGTGMKRYSPYRLSLWIIPVSS